MGQVGNTAPLDPEHRASLHVMLSVSQAELTSLRSESWRILSVVMAISVVSASILVGLSDGSGVGASAKPVALVLSGHITVVVFVWWLITIRLVRLQRLVRDQMKEIEDRLIGDTMPLPPTYLPARFRLLSSSVWLSGLLGLIVISMWWFLYFRLPG